MAPAPISWLELAETAAEQREEKLALAVTRPLGPSELELQTLCQWLCINSTVTELHLRSNSLGDKGAFGLAAALKENTGVEKLFLSGNGISGEGALHLADALMENATLEQLFLSVNQIGDYGAEQLAAALQANGTLQVLYLNGNAISDQGARHFKQALHANGSLEVLSLAGNDIKDAVLLKSISEKLERNKAGLGPAPGETLSEEEDEEEEEANEDEEEIDEESTTNTAAATQKPQSSEAAPHASSAAPIAAGVAAGTGGAAAVNEKLDSAASVEPGVTELKQEDSADPQNMQHGQQAGEVAAEGVVAPSAEVADSMSDLRKLQREKYEATRARREAGSTQQESVAGSSVTTLPPADLPAAEATSSASVKDEKALMMEMFEQLEQAGDRPAFPAVVVPTSKDEPLEEPDDLPPPAKPAADSSAAPDDVPDDLPPPSQSLAVGDLPPPSESSLPADLPPQA